MILTKLSVPFLFSITGFRAIQESIAQIYFALFFLFAYTTTSTFGPPPFSFTLQMKSPHPRLPQLNNSV